MSCDSNLKTSEAMITSHRISPLAFLWAHQVIASTLVLNEFPGSFLMNTDEWMLAVARCQGHSVNLHLGKRFCEPISESPYTIFLSSFLPKTVNQNFLPCEQCNIIWDNYIALCGFLTAPFTLKHSFTLFQLISLLMEFLA